MTSISIKRIYEKPVPADGMRILVDRLWPRGVSKDAAALDLWCKEIAPSPELRAWFDHRENRFAEFKKRYLLELRSNPVSMRNVLTSSRRAANRSSTSASFNLVAPFLGTQG